ncbi:MAG: filamentous hemagglutinin N-terminal domain-containing protein, partial [Sulfuritalea sp.]|nr:filamentous hemagglutinin N-terminal domain-containing protein [Sulfuritalea sp.]
MAACFVTGSVLSNPLNPTVVNGTATFNQAGSVLTVTNSNGAIINWEKFSIRAGETTHFAQTAASSTVLNRVLNDPTAIYGTLSSNGRVWLVNPAGIMVGPGGRIDTAGFVASTLAIRNEDFLAGRQLFVNDGSAQNVINQGEIRTPAGGSVYLIGSSVANEGIITTPGGETILAAGATVSLIDSATPGVKVDITGAEGNATNLGTITAEAGRVGIAGVIVRNSGQINASSVVSEGGRVFLKASQDAYVDGNGRIVTTGTRGGSVEVLGNRVAVTDHAEIDASGSNGGGKILVGGDFQGRNPDVQNANVSYFGPDAGLKADATGVGAGGTVIVWADDTTRAYGSISARGGAAGGDGGLVETSGKRYLDAPGIRVDVGAGNGAGGTWLLDPSAIDIVASGTTTAPEVAGVFSYGGDVGTVLASDINSALGFYGSVVIHTAGAGSGSGDINAGGVTISGPGSLTLAAYGGDTATGNINIYGGSNINVGGGFKALAGWDGGGYLGSDVIAGKGDINISRSWIHSSSNIDLHAGNDITLGHTGADSAGTWIQSNGVMSVSATNLSLFGGYGGGVSMGISDWQGPGVMLRGDAGQTIEVVNQILLQAGNINNTAYAGSPMHGGSVAIESGGSQDISASTIKLYAGASGHDNGAQIQAYGGQAITLYGGSLDVMGGGDNSASVYGGAGSFNNQARIQHGVWQPGNTMTGYDSQSITVYGGGTVTVQAGNGTGVLGYYGSDCAGPSGTYADACRGSSNTASIDNGVGNQTLAFTAGGSLAVTGGTSGSQNWAGIENKGSGQYITGNPDITLTGGSSGGRMVYGYSGVDHLSNDAGIFSQGVDDGQVINAGTLTIYGGGATFGGAGISSESGQPLDIHVAGNLSMYGGSSTAGDPLASAVFIGSDAAAQITIDVGGDVYIKSGSAGSGAAVIGSIGAAANVNLSTAAGRDITIIADASPVGIGSMETGYGASVIINSGRDLITSGSGVMIGSTYNYQSPTSVILNAARDISLGSGTFVGVDSPSPGYSGSSFIKLVAGAVGVDGAAMPNLSASYGSVIATGASFRTGGGSFTALASDNVSLGDVSTAAPMNSGSSGGLVTVTAYNGTIDVASISSRGADGGEGSAGSGGGVDIWAYGGVTIGTGGIDASGGDAGYGGWGTWGGAGGEVSITSQSGIVAVNGNILAKGGQGGSGTTGSSGFWSTEWLGVGDLFDYGYGYGYGYPSSTYSAPISSGAGGQGGEGGSILLTASGIGGGVQLGSVLLDVTGGRGGEGGAGYSGYSSAQSGGSGGWGGQGGFIDLSAPGTNGSISLGSVQLKAAGGEGGLGGHGGFVYGYAATGAKGGSGGQGGYGGSVTLSAGGQDGLIEIGAAQVYVDGGNGGKGGYGGDTYYFGYAGSGGMGGNGDSAGSITLTGGTGGISISGALFSARGGNAMVGGDSGQGYYGGMTGGGGMSAGAGGTIVMNSGSAIDLALVQIDAYGGDAVSGGGGGTVNMLADGGLTLGSGMITVSGGNASLSGGDGGEGGGWGGQGGGGGMVMLASQTGNVTVYGAIVANGGIGGAGSQGYDDTNYGGWVSGGTGGWGGSGGQGGNINLNAALGSVVLGSGVSLSANGGEGGTGGTGGSGTGLGGYYYNGYSWVASGGYGQGGTGGQGGQGGQGGIINLQGGSIMATGGASVEANGGSGGDAGVGGNGYGNSYSYGGYPGSAWAGSGGTGGTGGYGGVVSLGSSSGDITIVGGTLRARGGTGGDGNAAGAAYLDGSIQSGYGGYAGSGGDGGNYYYSAGQISLTSHGDIAISGLVDARGGDGGSGEYGGDAGFGGNVMMVAGSIGGNGTTGTTGSIVGGGVSVSTGGGGFTALAGDSITLGSINTDGADRTYGYSAGAVSMNAAYGSIEVTSISAQGGDSVSPDYYYSGGAGASGGGVNLQSYGGLIIGSGGINTSGGVGGDGSHGGGGGGGSAGPVTLTSVTDEIKINGNITARGGDGGD